jgi:hypothetical protein
MLFLGLDPTPRMCYSYTCGVSEPGSWRRCESRSARVPASQKP